MTGILPYDSIVQSHAWTDSGWALVGSGTFGGNAPMKIKTWANTTGEVSNVLFEDITLDNAAEAVSIGASYGTNACPCKWATDYGGPGQRGECRNYGPTLKGQSASWPASPAS
jgi:hypothetical protein